MPDLGGNFVTPSVHLMQKFDDDSAVQANILFSPCLFVYEFEQLEQAAEALNTTNSPYISSFFGTNSEFKSIQGQLNASVVLYQLPTVEIDTCYPITGRQFCRNQKFSGPASMLNLTYPQVTISSSELDLPISKWPKFDT